MAPEEAEPSWRGAYVVVIGALAIEVVLLAWMTWSYS
jgi:hypothetical protein